MKHAILAIKTRQKFYVLNFAVFRNRQMMFTFYIRNIKIQEIIENVNKTEKFLKYKFHTNFKDFIYLKRVVIESFSPFSS